MSVYGTNHFRIKWQGEERICYGAALLLNDVELLSIYINKSVKCSIQIFNYFDAFNELERYKAIDILFYPETWINLNELWEWAIHALNLVSAFHRYFLHSKRFFKYLVSKIFHNLKTNSFISSRILLLINFKSDPLACYIPKSDISSDMNI